MEFQNANENVFHGFGNLVISLQKRFGNVLKVASTNIVNSLFETLNYKCHLTNWLSILLEGSARLCGSEGGMFRTFSEFILRPSILMLTFDRK